MTYCLAVDVNEAFWKFRNNYTFRSFGELINVIYTGDISLDKKNLKVYGLDRKNKIREVKSDRTVFSR